MNKRYEIYSVADFVTSKWLGGSTTQLFIYPLVANYANRDFNFRLSTANVEIPESEFTHLPDVSRQIMILEGMITLKHENHHSKELNKFDKDVFKGDWKTSAKGICTDFNLMTTGKTKGNISALVIEKNTPIERNLTYCDFFFVYAFKGSAEIIIENNKQKLPFKHLLIIKKTSGFITFKSNIYSELVLVEVNL